MNAIQLDFFKTEEECRTDAILQEVKNIKTSTEKVRKKLFAENDEVKECVKALFIIVKDIDERMKIIERNICRGS